MPAEEIQQVEILAPHRAPDVIFANRVGTPDQEPEEDIPPRDGDHDASEYTNLKTILP
jgi:hypothetical protein